MSASVSLSEVQPIIESRCVACHASDPTQPGFNAPPAGLAYDTGEQIMEQMQKIQGVVASGYMPLGNITGITEEERATIAAWSP